MTIEFFGIHSIHVMRDSFSKLKNLCLSNAALSNIFKDTEWASQVEDTGWLKHVRTVLTGGIRIAVGMHRQGLSVLCHCSDGWDRTAQCVCIAQLCMDPYYRTVRVRRCCCWYWRRFLIGAARVACCQGFCGLIAKDWLAFGHKFQHRIGHADPKYDDSERSPVFIQVGAARTYPSVASHAHWHVRLAGGLRIVQFLDCVWQLVDQFPSAFEFNARLLLFLAHHLFSCRFGDFLFTCERERVDAALATCTPSIWGYVLQHRKLYTNPSYNAEVCCGCGLRARVRARVCACLCVRVRGGGVVLSALTWLHHPGRPRALASGQRGVPQRKAVGRLLPALLTGAVLRAPRRRVRRLRRRSWRVRGRQSAPARICTAWRGRGRWRWCWLGCWLAVSRRGTVGDVWVLLSAVCVVGSRCHALSSRHRVQQPPQHACNATPGPCGCHRWRFAEPERPCGGRGRRLACHGRRPAFGDGYTGPAACLR